jgi:glycosyltransferase involved in cell wall biosynthesis
MRLRVLQICCAPAPPAMPLAERLRRWRTLADVAEATARAGIEVTVLLDGHRDEALGRNGVDYRQVPGLRRPQFPTLRAAALARRHAPDVIHMVGLENPVVTRALCGTGIPVLAQDHASQPKRRKAPLWRWGQARLAAVAFTAEAQAEPFLATAQLAPRTRIFAIPESSSRFTPGDSEAARTETGIRGSPALLWVGHLNANKSPLTVLRAVQQLLPLLPGLELWCIFGDAPLRAEVDAMLAGDPALAARVHLLGRVPHERMEAMFRACDAYVSASRREGSGYALIEALACGLPAVVTDIPSFRAMTADGAVGALVPIGDSAAMADTILHLFASGTRRSEEQTRSIRDHFDAHLHFDVIGARLAQAYAALAGPRPPCA